MKKTRKWKTGKIPGPCMRTEIAMEYEDDSDTKHNLNTWKQSLWTLKRRGRIKIIHTPALLISCGILQRYLWKTPVVTDVKNSQRIKYV